MAENSNVDVEVTDTFVQEIDGVLQYGAGGTVFGDEDTSLLDAYNEVLAEIVADEGRHLSSVGHFGFTAEGLRPEQVTTELLCREDEHTSELRSRRDLVCRRLC